MTALAWDRIGTRTYESGLDRGVLYLPNGSAVPWSGLVSVTEKSDKQVTAVYYDGKKIIDLVVLGDYAATLSAVTYPKEFTEIEGAGKVRRGAYVHDQPPQVFSLSYRTRVNNDLSGEPIGHKLNLVYNITAVPSDKDYATESDDPSLVQFEWDLSSTPEEWDGYRPSAHISFDTTELDPWLLEDLEAMLYGNSLSNPELPTMEELSAFVEGWYRVRITDNGDGSWTAETRRPGHIFFLDSPYNTEFRLEGVNVDFVDDVTYRLSDTLDVIDIPLIKVTDNGDGTWKASTYREDLFDVTDEGEFEIQEANVVFPDPETYALSDTYES